MCISIKEVELNKVYRIKDTTSNLFKTNTVVKITEILPPYVKATDGTFSQILEPNELIEV